jgi:aspartate aminotransferase
MSVPLSATLAANEALARRRSSGLPVLPMAFGEAGLPVQPGLLDALAAAGTYNAYGPVAGQPALRSAAAGYWGRRGLPTDPDLVVAGPGSKPLLYALLLAIGGDVVVPCPSWVSYAAQANLLHRHPIFVRTPAAEGGIPEPELMARAVSRARAAGRTVRSVIVTLPDNPTGTLASGGTVRRLCQLARELNLIIISDEIYRDLVHPGGPAIASPAEFAAERTVITTALSKNLALGGWRMGVTRLPDGPLGDELRAELLGVASEIWSSPPGPIQHAAAYAFSEPPEIVDRVGASARLHATVASAVTREFAAVGAEVVPPQAAFYLYPDLEPWRERLAADLGIGTGPELTGHLLHEHGLGVLPAVEFGEPERALRMRVATSLLYGDTDERRQAALDAKNPLELPWISDALGRLAEVLTACAPADREVRAVA